MTIDLLLLALRGMILAFIFKRQKYVTKSTENSHVLKYTKNIYKLYIKNIYAL